MTYARVTKWLRAASWIVVAVCVVVVVMAFWGIIAGPGLDVRLLTDTPWGLRIDTSSSHELLVWPDTLEPRTSGRYEPVLAMSLWYLVGAAMAIGGVGVLGIRRFRAGVAIDQQSARDNRVSPVPGDPQAPQRVLNYGVQPASNYRRVLRRAVLWGLMLVVVAGGGVIGLELWKSWRYATAMRIMAEPLPKDAAVYEEVVGDGIQTDETHVLVRGSLDGHTAVGYRPAGLASEFWLFCGIPMHVGHTTSSNGAPLDIFVSGFIGEPRAEHRSLSIHACINEPTTLWQKLIRKEGRGYYNNLNHAIEWGSSDQIVIHAGKVTSDDGRSFSIPFRLNGVFGQIIGQYVPRKGTVLEVQMVANAPGNKSTGNASYSTGNAFYSSGNAKYRTGDLDGALADFGKAIELDPGSAMAYFGRAVTRQSKGDLDGAMADYNKVIELKPDHVAVYVNRALVKMAKGDFDGALADFSKAIELDPKSVKAYRCRGCLHYDRQAWAEALQDFRKAAELTPTDDKLRFRVWLVQARLGEPATKELLDYLNTRQGKIEDWGAKVGAFLTRLTTEAELLKAAPSFDATVNQKQHCEAYFYMGTKRLLDGRKIAAKDYFEKCVATGRQTFTEYQSAVAELKILKAEAK